jgi:hypothetical protein
MRGMTVEGGTPHSAESIQAGNECEAANVAALFRRAPVAVTLAMCLMVIFRGGA